MFFCLFSLGTPQCLYLDGKRVPRRKINFILLLILTCLISNQDMKHLWLRGKFNYIEINLKVL